VWPIQALIKDLCPQASTADDTSQNLHSHACTCSALMGEDKQKVKSRELTPWVAFSGLLERLEFQQSYNGYADLQYLSPVIVQAQESSSWTLNK